MTRQQQAFTLIFALLSLTGCSNKAVYDNLRQHQRNECLKAPPPVYTDCVERANKPFEEYQRERKEALEQQAARKKADK